MKQITAEMGLAKGYLRESKIDGSIHISLDGWKLVAKCEDCDHCPFDKLCEEIELYYGCPVWEEEMDDDL